MFVFCCLLLRLPNSVSKELSQKLRYRKAVLEAVLQDAVFDLTKQMTLKSTSVELAC